MVEKSMADVAKRNATLFTCTKCGHLNPFPSKYCEDCGRKLLTLKKAFSVARSDFSAIPKTVRRTIIIVVLILIIWGLMSLLMNLLTDPIHVANRYFDAYANNNYGKMYEQFGDLPEGDFVNKKMFAQLNRKDDNSDDDYNGKVVSYSVKESKGISTSSWLGGSDNSSKSDVFKTYSVEYYTRGSSNSRSTTLGVAKSDQKFLLFWDKWQIAVDGLIADNVNIRAEKGTTISFNDVNVDNSYIVDDGEEDTYVLYQIPYMLCGNYKVEVRNSDGEKYETEVSVSSGRDINLTRYYW